VLLILGLDERFGATVLGLGELVLGFTADLVLVRGVFTEFPLGLGLLVLGVTVLVLVLLVLGETSLFLVLGELLLGLTELLLRLGLFVFTDPS
jgi:hypothetical protein